jgi:hypothetical protein
VAVTDGRHLDTPDDMGHPWTAAPAGGQQPDAPRVVVPNEPPTLSLPVASALLRLLINIGKTQAARRSDDQE